MSETKALAIIPKSIDEVNDLAERFAKSSLLPKSMQGKAADVLVTIMAGQEMGLSPMASLRAIHVIDGKPVLSADGMTALVLGSGKAVYFERIEDSDTSVTYETLRQGAKTPRRCTWTMQMAKVAGLNLKDNWRQYPRAMLASRAKSELARDVYPDVLAGCYTDDEIANTRSERPGYTPTPSSKFDTSDAVDAELVEEQIAQDMNNSADSRESNALVAIEQAKSVEEMKSDVAKAIEEMKLPRANKARVNEAYKARMKTLREQESKSHPVTGSTSIKKLDPTMHDESHSTHDGAEPAA